ncbi:MAG: hypothetical protein RBT71_00100 [Flavobacteriales bacterium]|jgi:hypothetical protein|nr:hypothetical protein [Flavobacteriales bacterium]
MDTHKGMRPQDVAVLLKIVALGNDDWRGIDLAHALRLSPAEVSNSLKRSAMAGLVDGTKRRVSRAALLEFLKHGLPYVFPVRPGGLVRGVPTAHAAAPLRTKFLTADAYVWPYAKGDQQGQAIVPLYPGAVAAALDDPKLHELLALADALRTGRARERAEAGKELAKRLK